MTAIGEHRHADRHFQRCGGVGAERHRQIGRCAVCREAEAAHPVLGLLGADRLQDADRDHVARLGQGLAYRQRRAEAAIIVFRRPGLATGDAGIEHQLGVAHHGARHDAFFQTGRVDEGLEAGARLAEGLRHVVELALVEVETADQGLDGTALRIQGHQRGFHFRQLADGPAALVLDHAHDGAGADLLLVVGLVRQREADEAQAVAGDADGIVVAAAYHDLAGRGLGDDGGLHFTGIRVFDQRIGNRFLEQVRIGRQGDEVLGAAVAAACIVVQDAGAHRLVGGVLLFGGDGGIDVQAARVGIGTVLVINQLAHHFTHVFGVHVVTVGGALQHEFGVFGFVSLLLRDEAGLDHAVQDVELAHAGPARVHDRVVERGGLGQAGQHGGFGQVDLLQRLAEVGFGSGSKAVGAVAQEDLVHVDLEDLVLAEIALQLERQHHLVDLACEGLFGREVDVARHLHGDGGSALAACLAEVGQAGTHHADIVDAVVLVEARILDGQHGILHDGRNFVERHVTAAFFTEFVDQIAFGRVDAQRQLGLVVLQAGDIRQVGVGDGQGHGGQQGHGGGTGSQQADQPQEQADQPVAFLPGWLGRGLGRIVG